MSREEMIDILIKDKINEWVHAGLHEGLEWILECGWEGYDNFTDKELEEVFMELIERNFDEETAEKIRVAKIAIQNLTNKHERR